MAASPLSLILLFDLDEKIFGTSFMIWATRHGGLGQLRAHIRCHDQSRGGEKLTQMMEKQVSEENGVC